MPKRRPARNQRTAAKPAGPFSSAARYIVFAIVPAVLLVGGVYAAGRAVHAFFRIERIVLTGNEHLADDEVRAIAGLKGKESLFGVRADVIRQKLTASPWIRAVAVRKEYPGELHLRIREAQPFALLDMKGKLFIIDDEGRMLEELKSDTIPFLPVIAGNPYQAKEAYAEAVRLTRSIRKTGSLGNRERIEIVAKSPQELSAIVDGVLVKIGEGQYEEKLERLAEIEDEVRRRNICIDYIDLRFARQVVVKPVNEVVR